MMCPDCGGSGRVVKRFLFFFTRRARCRTCLGTGTFPPAIRPGIRMVRSSAARDWDEDRWSSPTIAGTSGGSQSRDSFDIGSGGRSGGGGAATSWDAPSDSPPVIADPFSSDAAVSSSAIASDAASADSGSSPASESSDGGTSY